MSCVVEPEFRLSTPPPGEALLVPSRQSLPDLVRRNEELRRSEEIDLLGVSRSELSRQARLELLKAAHAYTTHYRDVCLPGSGNERPETWDGLIEQYPVILAGHQPALVHPGVWVKNFLLSHLGTQLPAFAIHLLIDNDLARAPSIMVPGGSWEHPARSVMAFDTVIPPRPYEERPVLDSARFAGFAERVQEHLSPLIRDPLIGPFWQEAVAAQREGSLLGASLARARHRLEASWGLQTLEVPLSHIAAGRAFGTFAAYCLMRARTFGQTYNSALEAYRRRYRVRSQTHPVPRLAVDDEWVETPFWIWSDEDPTRRRLLLRRRAGGHEMTADGMPVASPLLSEDGPMDAALLILEELRDRGHKLRPRALTTTLFARLFLADLFVHGIGGAKYDRLTDEIMRRFFRVTPPGFAAMSATLTLPIPPVPVQEDDLRRIEQTLRDIRFHPENHLQAGADGEPWRTRKLQAVTEALADESQGNPRRERHLRIVEANRQMRTLLSTRVQELQQLREQLRQDLRRRSLLESREYAFCLFPEENLRSRLLEFGGGDY